MIVEMSRVLTVGPKRLLAPVLETLQGIGSLHIDRIEAEEAPTAFSSVTPQAAERTELDALERLRARVDGLLSLLPTVPVDPAPATEDLAAQLMETLEAEAAALEAQVGPLTRQRLELQDELELIHSYGGAVRVLSPLLGALAGSRAFETVGFILRTKDLALVQDFRGKLQELTGGRVEVVSRVVEEGKVGVVVAFHRRDAEAVHGFLARAGVSELRLPTKYADLPPDEAIRTMESRRAQLPGEMQRITADLEALARTHRSRLVGMRAVLQDRLTRLQIVPSLSQSRYTFVVHGWTPTRAVGAVRQRLRRRFGEEVVVYDSPADPHEAERVPVLLDNPAPIKPFQLLLGLFPPPRYGTWDPSPLIAVTFPLFVGLVIGDVGYGLLFFLAGWAMRNRARAGKSLSALGVTLDPHVLKQLSWLIRVLAFWVIVFGVMFTEFFGNLPELLFHVHPIFNRLSDQNSDLYFNVIILVGVAMVYLGLLWHLLMSISHRHAAGIFESLVITFASAALLIFLGTEAGRLPAALAPWSVYLIVASLLTLAAALASRKWMSPMWFLESFTAFGHVLSHVRLMAFGLAAAMLPGAANEIGPEVARELHVPAVLATVFATGVAGGFQILFFVFTIIGHLIQPARLHWVEFLMKVKYFEESGRPYRPFQRSGGG